MNNSKFSTPNQILNAFEDIFTMKSGRVSAYTIQNMRVVDIALVFNWRERIVDVGTVL